jgi:hypothetical protein
MHRIIQIASGDYLRKYLAGPRTPAEVRKLGYRFTSDRGAAWPFATEKQATAKLRIVDRHMGGALDLEVVP